MTTCTFCGIVADDLPAHRIYADDRVIGFLDINPATPGHALVVPRAHVADIHEIDPDDLAACARAAQTLAQRVTRRMGADGVNLLNSAGAAAWQGVFHFHLHVVPRYVGDALREPWRRAPGQPAQLAALARKLS
ncbi:MAG TPA: HIT family protein [Pilimelia sp.]|nr:HIT family protein [Pilimelia sp.]